MMSQQRDAWVDHAKGIGIILVVYGHVLAGLLKTDIFAQPAFHQLCFSIIYTFHMPLFFFLAGIYFENSFKKRGASILIANKVDTVIYPYLVWSVIQYSIQIFLSDHTNSKISYDRIPQLILMSGAQFWFLYTLFFVFVVCSVIRRFFPVRSLMAVLTIFLLVYLYQKNLPEGLSPNRFYNSIIFFIVGIFYGQARDKFDVNSRLSLVILTVSFLLAQYYFHYVLGYSASYIGIEWLVLAFISVFFICAVSKGIKPGALPWLAYLGEHSMPIYLMNIIGTAGARIILGHFMGINDGIVHIVIGFLIGLLGPIIFYRLSLSLRAGWLYEPVQKISLQYFLSQRSRKVI